MDHTLKSPKEDEMKVEMRKFIKLYMILPQNSSGIDEEMQENRESDEGERELQKLGEKKREMVTK